MYLTENLDKVRELIGSGTWGDNRPERLIKHRAVMNSQEKEETKDLLVRLAAVLRHEEKAVFEEKARTNDQITVKFERG